MKSNFLRDFLIVWAGQNLITSNFGEERCDSWCSAASIKAGNRRSPLKKSAQNDKIPLCHRKGDDVHGQVYPQGETEQESSEGTQSSAARHLGFQPGHEDS